jgi:hypothetical protein
VAVWNGVLVGLLAWPSRPAAAQVTADDVEQAIQRGIAYLKAEQQADGGWSAYASFPGGTTALCTLALLNCGVPVDDPVVARALLHLRKLTDLEQTYTVALQTMALCAAEPQKDKFQISRNVGWLQSAQRTKGNNNGSWGYSKDPPQADNSNAQFALLALLEAERAGVQVQESTWRRALAHWQRQQRSDGAWTYTEGAPPTGSMTCAGVASLMISSGQIARLDAQVVGDSVRCCGPQEADATAIERGIAWLNRNFSVRSNPGSGDSRLLYYLYALERVGRLSGRRFIGQHDWYREGAEMLIELQDPLAGFWQVGDPGVVSTSFALLFLSKGRRPVLVAKLRRPPEDDWNRHRNDIAHLTRYVEGRWQQDLTWQTVDLTAATAEDLLQSPVLFVSGRDGLPLTPAQKKNLRNFVDGGGFLFVETCCDGQAFDRDFRSLMRELFPDSPLRLLPPDHPVWYAEQRVDARYLRPLLGIDACCRTGVVYCPRDLSCFWELATQQRNRRRDYPPAVQEEIDACLAIGANVLAYATGRELRDKLEDPELVSVLKAPPPEDRAALRVAKLQHSGGADDAPTALANLLSLLQEHSRLRVSPEKYLVAPTDTRLADYPIAFLHGRRRFRFSPEQREALARFVANGGVILADAICASAEFADALREEVAAIWPERPLERIPPTHPLFTDHFHGHDVTSVTLRDPKARARSDDPLAARLERTTPLLEGIEMDDRYVVIFSPYDISCALENRPSLECRGYIRQDAMRLGINLILYAMQQ